MYLFNLCPVFHFVPQTFQIIHLLFILFIPTPLIHYLVSHLAKHLLHSVFIHSPKTPILCTAKVFLVTQYLDKHQLQLALHIKDILVFT